VVIELELEKGYIVEANITSQDVEFNRGLEAALIGLRLDKVDKLQGEFKSIGAWISKSL
jgi:hypothetical protein